MKRTSLLAVGLGLGLALAHFSFALAHAVLLSSTPNPNSTFPPEEPPTRVELTFSESVAASFSAIRVLNQTGEAVDNGDTQTVNVEYTTLAVSLKPLEPGLYTVAWKVLSSIDGHTSSGAFTFGVGVAAPQTTAVEETAIAAPGSTPASLGARWLTLTGQVLLLGLFVFRFLVWRPTLTGVEDDQLDLAMARQALRVGWVGLGLVGVGMLLTLIAQSAAIGDVSFESFKLWLGIRFGGMWFTRFWLSLGLIFNLADLGLGLSDKEQRQEIACWEWWLGLILSVALGLTSTLVSHSAALQEEGWLAVVADAAHLLAAGVWVGGLVQLFIAIRLTQALRQRAKVSVNLNLLLNFSTVAAGAVGILLVSGSYLAWQYVGSWAALFKTTYGLTLLTKIGLALPAFAIAALNLLVIKPRFTSAMSAPNLDPTLLQRRFNRLALAEASFALAVVAAAGFLTDLQRGRDALLLAEQARAVFLQPADDLQVTLTVEPGLWGQANIFDVHLVGADGEPVLDAREVVLRFTFLDRSLGTNEVTTGSLGDGHYRNRGTYLSLNGYWQVKVAIRRPNIFDSFATFKVEAAPDGKIRPLNNSPDLQTQLVDWLTRSGSWFVGLALTAFALGWVLPAVLAARRQLYIAFLLIPSLIAVSVGMAQIVEAIRGSVKDAPSDPEALNWLVESDAAMNKLTSAQLTRTTRGDNENGPVLTETVFFQAPNMFHDWISNGSENVAQGNQYYFRQEGESLWQAVTQSQPFVFPDFDTSKAVSAQMGQIEKISGRPMQTVTYILYIVQTLVTFTRWIDPETRLILREYMDAPGHHMLSVYSGYNEPVTITIPDLSEIGPTPTAIVP